MNEFYWLVGILEGEGCFKVHKKSNSPQIQIIMTDLDIMERAADIFEANLLGPYKDDRKESYRDKYQIQFSGIKAIYWMKLLYFDMGERRQEQIDKCVECWGSVNRSKSKWSPSPKLVALAQCINQERALSLT